MSKNKSSHYGNGYVTFTDKYNFTIPCRVISGTATNSIGSTGLHAWNQVQLDGRWYYIDCTWDDPTGGGHERTTYYLNENLWANHIEETSEDFVDNDIWHWENYYLTGEKWNK